MISYHWSLIRGPWSLQNVCNPISSRRKYNYFNTKDTNGEAQQGFLTGGGVGGVGVDVDFWSFIELKRTEKVFSWNISSKLLGDLWQHLRVFSWIVVLFSNFFNLHSYMLNCDREQETVAQLQKYDHQKRPSPLSPPTQFFFL